VIRLVPFLLSRSTVTLIVLMLPWPALLAGPARTILAAAGAPQRDVSVRLSDETDRAAFRQWLTYLADAQFERRTDDVIDCASLVRHAYREALRPHSPDWYRRSRLPLPVSFPDVRRPPHEIRDGAWLLFRVADRPVRYGEFADAATLVRLNARLIGRDPLAAESGDLLYFRQEDADTPDHLMLLVGESRFDPSRRDWVVYHTGPQPDSPGEVRKVSLAALQRHPSPRWRPLHANRAFVGVYRLSILDRAQ
jgi:uncharacterized protein YfaT (DUF1175 family)